MQKTSGQNKKRVVLLVTLAVVLALNLAAVFLPYRTVHPDVSGGGVYTLSESTERYLAELDRPAQITYFASAPDADLRAFLELYRSQSVTVTVAEPETADADQTIRIRCGETSRTVGLAELYYYTSSAYSSTYGMLSLSQYAQISSAVSGMSSSDEIYREYLSLFGPDVMQAHFCGEEVISSVLRNLTGGTLRTLWVWTGRFGTAPDWFVSLRLKMHGYEVRGVNDLSALSDGSLLWLTPQTDLDEAGAAALTEFLSHGGRLFLTTSYQVLELPTLMEVLSAYGLSAKTDRKNLVCDKVSYGTTSMMSVSFPPKRADHAINESVGGSVLINGAHEILLADADGVDNLSLLKTSSSGQLAELDGDGNQTVSDGTFTVAATAVRSSDSSRIAWLGMPLNSAFDYATSNGESAYTAAILAWLAGDRMQFTVGETRTLPSAILNVSVTVFTVWIIIFVLLIPLLLLAIALVRRYIRKPWGREKTLGE